jgi:NTE family protein
MEIVLALGGGGPKGAAHVGVLDVLTREGFEIKALAGTSIGGLVGAVYISGVSPDEIKDAFKGLELTKLYGREKGDEPSLLGLAGIARILTEFLGAKTFADLPVPFATTAVDLNTGEVLIFQEGPLVEAVLATIAVPGVFPARRWNERLLIDGGVLCPVPIGPARDLMPGFPLVAVVLNQLTKPGKSFSVPETSYANPVVGYISKLRLAQALNVFIRSTEHSGRLLTELVLQTEKPDLVIRPDLHDVGFLDNIDVSVIAERGEQAAVEILPEVRSLMKTSKRLQRWLQRRIGEIGARS